MSARCIKDPVGMDLVGSAAQNVAIPRHIARLIASPESEAAHNIEI